MIFQRSPNNRVKNVVKLCGLVTWCLLAGLFVGIRPVLAEDAVVGDGTAASCTEITFGNALFSVQFTGGGTITFNCGADIRVIEFFADPNGKNIYTNVVINAANKIVLNARNERRHFYVSDTGHLTLQSISLINGKSSTIAGGSIYNVGTLTITNSTLSDNSASEAGGIFNDGTLTVSDSTLSGNLATTHNGGGITNALSSTLTVSNSTFSGNSAIAGGGIANSGTLSVSNSTLSGNSSVVRGGGIYNDGTLTISNGTIFSNSAQSDGGGIANNVSNSFGALTVISSTLSGNSADLGGGISNGGALTVSTSLLSSNSANQGGGIFNQNLATLISSTLSGNLANEDGGGIFNSEVLTVSNSTLSGNLATRDGGGIFNLYFSRMTVMRSTLAGNSATQDGGGIANRGALTMSNSTLSGNLATRDGGGIANNIPNDFGRLTISNSTFSSNSANRDGGGLANYVNGRLLIDSSTFAYNSANAGGGVYDIDGSSTISNSIIANSPLGGDCAGNLTANGGHNLVEDDSCGASSGSDPKLGPLQDNSGPTFTHALLAGSPAINKGASSLATDQRGILRPQGSGVDIGAFELVYINSAPVANAQTVVMSINTAKTITLTGSDIDNDVLTYTVTSNPISGTLSGTVPNIIYTPNSGFHGNDSFTYAVTDSQGVTTSATITVTVQAQISGAMIYLPLVSKQ